MKINRNEFLCGAIFVAVGAFFAIDVFVDELRIGTAFRMGPGYVPLVLAGLLMVLGIAIAVAGIRAAPQGSGVPTSSNAVAAGGEPTHPVPWRGIVAILASPVLFGISIQTLGLIPSL